MNIAPLPHDFLHRARVTGLDAQNQPVRRLTAKGGEPCRDVLRRARPGEELILCSFSPFSVAGPYREYGPVFILADDSEEARPADALPLDGYLREQFVLRAYTKEEEIFDAALVQSAEAEATLERFLATPEVAFVHARFPAYGCFALRVDR